VPRLPFVLFIFFICNRRKVWWHCRIFESRTALCGVPTHTRAASFSLDLPVIWIPVSCHHAQHSSFNNSNNLVSIEAWGAHSFPQSTWRKESPESICRTRQIEPTAVGFKNLLLSPKSASALEIWLGFCEVYQAFWKRYSLLCAGSFPLLALLYCSRKFVQSKLFSEFHSLNQFDLLLRQSAFFVFGRPC